MNIKKVVFCFGRFQPCSIGHKYLFDFMNKIAELNRADVKIYSSHTQDSNKNPLEYKDKVKFLKLSFPEYNKNIIISNSKTIFDVLNELVRGGYTDIILVAGGDRVNSFKKAIIPYINNNDSNSIKLNAFKVINAGNRDPDSDSYIKSISSSKLRSFAKRGQFKKFISGISSTLSLTDSINLFNMIRNGLKININKKNINMKNIKENNIDNNPGFDPGGNPSRLWQTFRNWFYIQENDLASDYLVVDKKTGERHLPVKKNGKPNHILMGAAYAALTGGYRGNKYKGPNSAEALNKLKKLYKQENLPLPE